MAPKPVWLRGWILRARSLMFAVVVLVTVFGAGRVHTIAAESRSVTTVDQAGDVGLHTSMTLDASGNPVIAYVDRTTNNLKVLHCNDPACAPGGDSITTPLQGVIGVGDQLGHTAIQLNSSGNPVVAFYKTPSKGDLFVLFCNDANCAPGGEVAVPVAGTIGTDEGRYVSMQLRATGRPTFAFYDATNSALKVVRCIADLCGSTVSNTLDSVGQTGEYPSMVFDASGNPVIAYQALSGSNRVLRMVHCDDVDCAMAPTPEVVSVVDSGGGSGQYGYYTSIALDASGFPVIAHIDEFFSELRVVHCSDANCTSSTKNAPASIGALNSNYPSLKLDSGSFPVVAFYDGSSGDLKVLHCDDANCAPGGNTVNTVDGASTDVGQYPAMQLSAGGLPVISYYDSTNDDLKVTRCDTANCAPGGAAGTLQFESSTFTTLSEGLVQVSVFVTRTGGSTGAVTVSYATSNGTAIAGSDYTATSGTLSWGNGVSGSQVFEVYITDDALVEPMETVNLALSNPTGGATLGAQSTAVINIVDNDSASAGTLAFTASSFAVGEAEGSKTITVSRTGGSAGAVGVTYGTSNGTATAGTDYTAASGTLSWTNGDTADKSFSVFVTNDGDDESDETVALALSSPTGGASLGSPAAATLSILDDDGILPFAPSSLAFTSQPSDGIVNVALPGQPVVSIVDATGATVTSDQSTSVTLTLQVPPPGTVPAGPAAPEADLPTFASEPIPVYATDIESSVRNLAPEEVLSRAPGAQTAQFRITYTGAWPAEAKSALVYATQIWGALITSGVPIDINADWGILNGDILAIGGPRFISASDTPPGRWQLTAIYNRDKGSDQSTSTPDINLIVNSTTPNYYYGVDGVVPAGKVDFVSTMVHELGHGLGIVAGAKVNDDVTEGYWSSSTMPYPFTDFIRNGGGQKLFSLVAFPNNSGALLAQFTGGSLFFAGPQAQAANGGQPVPLFAPNPWNGSNVSHVAESFNGTADALMTWRIDQREVQHNPGPVTRAMLRDIGWGVASGGGGSITFGAVTTNYVESAGLIRIPVVRGGDTSGAAQVSCGLGTGATAVAPSDFIFNPNTPANPNPQVLNWTAGSAETKYCELSLVDDLATEGNETISVVLSSPSGATLGNPSTVTLTIADNDGAPPSAGIVQFKTTTSQMTENGPALGVEVTRTGGTAGAVTATCTVTGGTATGGDYTVTGGIVSWGAGESGTRVCILGTLNDGSPEAPETVLFSLTGLTGGATAGTPAQHTVTINDDDSGAPGTLQFGAAPSVTEQAASFNVEIPVTRTGGSTGSVSVLCSLGASSATFGADFTVAGQRLIWANGDNATKLCVLTVLPDQLAEGVELAGVALNDPTGGAAIGTPSTAQVSILDNDGGPGLLTCDQNPKLPTNGVVSFTGCRVGAVGNGYRIVATATTAEGTTSQQFNIGEPGATGTVQFTQSTRLVDEDAGVVGIEISRSGGSLGTASVTCTAGGGTANAADYRPVTVVLTWAAGDTSTKLCPVAITDDEVTEPNKTFVLTLSLPTGATLGAQKTLTVTIQDDDPPRGTLQFSSIEYVSGEAGGAAVAQVTRVAGSAGQVTVYCATAGGGSATQAVDYSPVNQLLTWANGDTAAKNCTVPVTNDTTPETDETIHIQLVSPGGGATIGTPAEAVLRVTDNDGVGASFTYPGPAVNIPDGNTTGVWTTLVVSGAPTPITDLNVFLHIHHTWVGDLIVILRSPQNTDVTLLLAPGAASPSDFGCSGNDVEATFDDAATTPADTNCSSTTGLTTGPYRPLDALSAFNGQDPNGTWGLWVQDRNAVDTGALQDFRLTFAGATLPPASVSGHVYKNSASPANAVSGANVSACTATGFCRSATTDSLGAYTITDIPAGSYTLRTYPPGSFGPATAGPVVLTPGQLLSGQDLLVYGHVPPPPGTSITPGSTSTGGLPVVSWSQMLTLRSEGCSGGTASYTMSTQAQGIVRSGPMAEFPAGTYTALVAALRPISGYAHVTITINCPGGSVQTTDFDFYIDPSGYVRTTTGEPIPGATVTLYRSDAFTGPFAIVPDGSAIMSLANRANPSTTDSVGHFGWDVMPGYYRVRASYPGCVSPTDPSLTYSETHVMVVPPPVTDLDIRLDCGTLGDAPAALRLEPSSVKAGQGKPVRVVVTGGGFTSNSSAIVDGVARSGVATSNNTYEFILSASEVQTVGTITIEVETPGAGRSTLLTFSVRAQPASDADCNASVSLPDAIAIRRHIAGLGTACAPDTDLDGTATALDALYVLKVLAGLLPE